MPDGKEGCNLTLKARDEGRPYAVAFVDMRMPGGWDGLKTIEELWRVDADIEVVICSAFSDYTWDDIISRLGHPDRLHTLSKPFQVSEVLRLASALSEKWRLRRKRQTP